MHTVTCFSYKGGAGRSTSAANLAVELAKRGKRVALIDADLGAPGLHYIFGAEDTSEDPSYVGTHHLVNDMIGMDEVFDVGLIDVGKQHRTQELWSVDAGLLFLLASSPAHMPAIDASDYAVTLAKTCMRQLRHELAKREFDYMILDSASGLLQPIAGVCIDSSDLILVFFRWTLQHVRGTAECVKELLQQQAVGECPTLATVATCVPDESELKALEDHSIEARLTGSLRHYESILAGIGESATPVAQIPEYPPFKWAESVAVFESDIYQELADYVEDDAIRRAADTCT